MKLGHVEARGGGLAVHAWGWDAGLAAVHVGDVPEVSARRGRVPVEGIEMQPRWRPVWFAELARDGGARASLCVRGERTDAYHGFSLEHEMKLQQLLHEHGIPVPQVHGWIDEPRAYVMDAVPAARTSPSRGMPTRDAVMDHYMEILAAIHRSTSDHSVEAGPDPRRTPGSFRSASACRPTRMPTAAGKKRPDPFLEFCLAWLQRNPLTRRDAAGERPIVWDSGQFHHERGRVIAALLDLEIGHIGDPMMDLAGFRMRSSVVGYGDLDRLYAHYAQVSG